MAIRQVSGSRLSAAPARALARSWRLPFLAVVVVIVLIAAGVYLALTNIRFAIAAARILAALALLLSNLVGYLRHR